MTNEEAIHIIDVAFGVPQAVRRFREDRTYHEAEIREAKDMAIKALSCSENLNRCDLISREETLTAFADYVGSGMSMNDYDALWDIVAKMPSVKTQEPCKDTISRQAAIRLAEQGQVQGFEWQFKQLTELPPVSTEKTGRWIRWYEVIESADGKSADHIPHCKCSECDCEYDTYSSQFIKYCPNCGAKMEVENG